MININELAHTIEKTLNDISTNNEEDIYFKSFVFGTFLDDITDKKNEQLNRNFIPVVVHSPEGNYEPIPNVGIVNQTHTIDINFPLPMRDKVLRLIALLKNNLVGKVVNYGSLSGSALTTISAPELVNIDTENYEQYVAYLSDNFNVKISLTDYWGIVSFEIYTLTSDNLGKENGLIFGNNVIYFLSFRSGGIDYAEELIVFNANQEASGSPISQQLLNEKKQTSVINTSAYGRTVEVYVRNTPMWKKLLELYNLGELQNVEFTLHKRYIFDEENDDILAYTFKQVIISFNENIQLGKLLTCSISFVDKAQIE